MAAASVRGFFQRTGTSLKEYFKRMGNDYATVAKETVTGCKERPVKAAVVFSGLGFLTYAYHTNPTELEMLDYLCERRQQLVLVPNSEHNPVTAKELTARNFLLSQDRLHYYNLWFFSLLVSSNHNNKLRIYSSQDTNLKDWPWTELWRNIVDVGYLGRWHNMASAFVDYDINTDEINLLPDGEKMADKYATILDNVCDPLTVSKFCEKSSITRQEAISILQDYVKTKGAPIWALYEISGTVGCSQIPFLPANGKMVKHLVVPESELKASEEQFEEVISTCLHSIQRTNPKETRVYGRSWSSNDDLIGVKVPQQENKKKVQSPKKIEVKKEKSASPGPSSVQTKPVEPVKKEKKTIVQPKKPQSVMSMFAKKAEKKTEEPEKSKSPSPPPPQEKKARKRPKVEIDEPEERPKDKTPEKKQKSLFESNDDDYPSSREQSVEKEVEPAAKKRKGVNDENRKVTKAKRKLIVPDSDDEEEQKMEVDEVKEEKPKKKETKSEERRRTTRMEKVVETYVDEDGYLVSKEVTKAVECSPQKSPEKPKPKVITAPVPGESKAPKKNATITSFFKKK